MKKKYLNKNVYDAVQERLKYIFAEFENVLVAFSGGKDSGVMLNLCYDYAKKNDMLHKMAMFHIDYEAQYTLTTDYVDATFKKFSDIKRYWLCLPVAAQCSVNMSNPYWFPWKKADKNIWVRDMPHYPYVVTEDNVLFKFKKEMPDYEMQDNFAKWFSQCFGTTAVMVGIRADESLNRFRAVGSHRRTKVYDNKNYILSYGDDLTYKVFPIYDWGVRDIWVANARFGYEYNRLYDLFYQAGLTIDQMRVASPFNDCATYSLKFYKAVEPNMWGKLIGRVNGVNFAGLYGGTTAMGWRSITLPQGHTWKSYCYFLLSTLDPEVRKNYEEKLNTSIRFWREKGGAVSDDTVRELEGAPGINNLGRISNVSSKDIITFDDYPDDLNVTNFREVPTYKRMCVCIMKNDFFCKYMGFAPTKKEEERKKRALEMYKNL